eukprot:gene10830-12040_t
MEVTNLHGTTFNTQQYYSSNIRSDDRPGVDNSTNNIMSGSGKSVNGYQIPQINAHFRLPNEMRGLYRNFHDRELPSEALLFLMIILTTYAANSLLAFFFMTKADRTVLNLISFSIGFPTVAMGWIFLFLKKCSKSIDNTSFFVQWRPYTHIYQNLFLILLSFFLALRVFSKVVYGQCESERHHFAQQFFCNPHAETKGLPLDAVLSLVLVPLLYSSILRDTDWSVILFSWVISAAFLLICTLKDGTREKFMFYGFYIALSGLQLYANQKLNIRSFIIQQQLSAPLASFVSGLDLIADIAKEGLSKVNEGSYLNSSSTEGPSIMSNKDLLANALLVLTTAQEAEHGTNSFSATRAGANREPVMSSTVDPLSGPSLSTIGISEVISPEDQARKENDELNNFFCCFKRRGQVSPVLHQVSVSVETEKSSGLQVRSSCRSCETLETIDIVPVPIVNASKRISVDGAPQQPDSFKTMQPFWMDLRLRLSIIIHFNRPPWLWKIILCMSAELEVMISQTTVASRASPLRILIVDDSATIQKMMGMMLRRHGHKVDQADNGAHGYTLVTHPYALWLQEEEKAIGSTFQRQNVVLEELELANLIEKCGSLSSNSYGEDSRIDVVQSLQRGLSTISGVSVRQSLRIDRDHVGYCWIVIELSSSAVFAVIPSRSLLDTLFANLQY